MTSAISLDARALERFDVPVIRVGFDAKVRYANQAALNLAGLKDYKDVDLAALLAQPEEWKAVQRHLQTRAQGEPASYPIQLRRADDGRIVPVKVYAIPEVGPDGTVIGSMAFITNEHEARISQEMHKAIERTRSSKDILDRVHALLRQLIDYDSLRVSAISKSRKHLCQLYCSMPEPKSYRWWRIRPHVEAMIDDDQPKNIDVDELFSRPGFLAMRDEPATAGWLRYGFKNLLSIPVKRGSDVVAWLCLETTRAEPFPRSAFDTCARLPLSEAVLMALHYEEGRRRDVVIELIQELAKGNDPKPEIAAPGASPDSVLRSESKRAADILVQKCASEFGWEHVSIFRHDEENNRLRPLSQAGLALPEDFSIASNEGLVGRAFEKQETVIVGDVRLDDRYKKGVENIISELCVPVPGSRSRWVVNIESTLENAFAEEEVETVQMLVREAGSILDRTAMLETRDATLASIKDAVIETDRRGTIRDANRAAANLLGVKRRKELRGRRLSEFFPDRTLKTAIERGEHFSRREASLKAGEREEVSVLISGALLPQDLGGKVFVISDLSYARQIQQLDMINEVFRQAALESRVPLAIAVAGVRELAETNSQHRAECVDKILRQLRKVDLPLERLLHLARPGEPHPQPREEATGER